MKVALPVGLSLVLGFQAALAGPLQRSQVAADATWFVHLDFDRLKQTEVGRYFLGELEKPQAGISFTALRTLIDFDARKKLTAGTLYSRGATPEDAVLLLRGDFEVERLGNVAQAGQDHRRNEHRSYTVHNWLDSMNPARGARPTRSYGAMHTNGTIVLGQRFGRVTEAIDVLDGLQSSLAKTNAFKPAGAGGGSSFLVGVARLADLSQLAPQAAMLKALKMLTFSATETDNNLALELVLEAENEEAAKNILIFNQGLLALASMQGKQSPWTRMLQGISARQTNSTVRASLNVSAAELVQMMKDANAAGPRPR